MHTADMQTVRFNIERVGGIARIKRSTGLLMRKINNAVTYMFRSADADVANIMQITNDALRGVEQGNQRQQNRTRT